MRTRLNTAVVALGIAVLAPASRASAADSNCPNANATPDQVSVATYASSLLCVVNETRHDWGRQPLATQRNLLRAAGWQADDMAEKNYFSHRSADGDTLADRLDQANFIPSSDRWEAGENLAAGHDQDGSPAAIVSGWMQSRDHRINLLDPTFTMVGIAASRGWPGTSVADDDSLTIAMDLGWRRR
ncbi:MAG TPA: CAP domain-containing protein [Thermoleophilaceae bacterium]